MPRVPVLSTDDTLNISPESGSESLLSTSIVLLTEPTPTVAVSGKDIGESKLGTMCIVISAEFDCSPILSRVTYDSVVIPSKFWFGVNNIDFESAEIAAVPPDGIMVSTE